MREILSFQCQEGKLKLREQNGVQEICCKN